MPQALQMIQDNRVTLVQQYHTAVSVDNSMATLVADLTRRYTQELQCTRQEEQRLYRDAIHNGRYAQAYAEATVMLGQRATQELEDRDYRCYELEAVGAQYEHLAQRWESSFSSAG